MKEVHVNMVKEVDAMVVCVTATGKGLDAEVDPRFGRARFFVFVNTDTMECESVPNPNIDAVGGAGIQSARLVAERGAEVVITGHVGPNAAEALKAAGIRVITGVQGVKVREALERLEGEDSARGDTSSKNLSEKEAIKRELQELKKRIQELEKRVEELE